MRTRALVVHRAMCTCVVVARTGGAETGNRGGLPCDYQYPCDDYPYPCYDDQLLRFKGWRRDLGIDSESNTRLVPSTVRFCCGPGGTAQQSLRNRRLRRCARCGAVDQHRATLLSGPARPRHRWQTLRGVARPRRRKLSARPLRAVLPATVGSKPEARAVAHHSTHRPRERLGPIPPMVLTSQAQPDHPEAWRPCGSRARRYFGLARPEAAAGSLQRVT